MWLGNGYALPTEERKPDYVPGLIFLADPMDGSDELTEVVEEDSLFDSLVRPVPGHMTSSFGLRKNPVTRRRRAHNGIDLHAARGTPVMAALDGKIVRAKRSRGYGKAIFIDHGDGVETRYAHLSVIDVKPGQEVSAGQVIGQVGSTGRATGPHLHFEVRVDGDAINPLSIDQAFAKPPREAVAKPFLWSAKPPLAAL